MSDDYQFSATVDLGDEKEGKRFTTLLKEHGFSWVMDINRSADLARVTAERDAACQFICELDAELDGLEQHGFELLACVNKYRAHLLLHKKPK